MSSTKIIYFMYHHYQHCSIRATPPLPPKSPDSFTLFPLLPPELRLRIWEIVASEPRTVELSCTPTASYIPNGRWFSHSKPPIFFSVCSESRDVGLMEHSILEFPPEQMGIAWPKLYINFAVDTLWLCADLQVLWAKELFERSGQLKENLRYLAVNETMWKALNPLFFTPGFAMADAGGTYVDKCPQGVRGSLRALEGVKFHS